MSQYNVISVPFAYLAIIGLYVQIINISDSEVY
jgi:hypothetical protein